MNRNTTMSAAVRDLDQKDNPVIIEVGRTRSSYAAETDGFSTIYFTSFLNHKGDGSLISIDINRDTEVICRAIINSIKQTADRIKFINEDALDCLKQISVVMADLFYLDGLDCDENEQASADWHLKCFELAHPMIKSGGLLLVDDVMDPVNPRGKGTKIIPAALEFGYSVVLRDYQWLLRKT